MRHDFANGKYTVINDNGKLTALRYGQPWRESDLVGDNLVYSMLVEVDALRQEVSHLRQAQQAQQHKPYWAEALATDAAVLAGDVGSLSSSASLAGQGRAHPAPGPARMHSPERAPGSAPPAGVGPDVDLNCLGGDIASMLVQRTRELWGLAMADFDRGLSQLERMHGAVVVPSAVHDRSAHAGQSTAQPVQQGVEETAEAGAEEGPGSAAMPQALRHR
jgi:hypothetical protein